MSGYIPPAKSPHPECRKAEGAAGRARRDPGDFRSLSTFGWADTEGVCCASLAPKRGGKTDSTDNVPLLEKLPPASRVLLAVCFACATTLATSLSAQALLLVYGGALLLLSGVSPGHAAQRLLPLWGMLLLLWVTLPFGAPSLREGVVFALAVTLKATGALLAFLALLGTLPPEELFRTLGRFGVPPKLLLLFHFTHRYAFVFRDEAERVLKAMRLRALPRACRGRAFADGDTWWGAFWGEAWTGRSVSRRPCAFVVLRERCRPSRNRFPGASASGPPERWPHRFCASFSWRNDRSSHRLRRLKSATP
jgi:hypothetical protein